MAYALAFSIAINAALVVVILTLVRRRRGRPLPYRKPDFTEVEAVLRERLATPEMATLLKLETFVPGKWLSRAAVVHVGGFSGVAFKKTQELVRVVSQRCRIPGRVAGSVLDPSNPACMIGDTIEFGYSVEVGYRHPNEFWAAEAAS